jgi:hypothetical protein
MEVQNSGDTATPWMCLICLGISVIIIAVIISLGLRRTSGKKVFPSREELKNVSKDSLNGSIGGLVGGSIFSGIFATTIFPNEKVSLVR